MPLDLGVKLQGRPPQLKSETEIKDSANYRRDTQGQASIRRETGGGGSSIAREKKDEKEGRPGSAHEGNWEGKGEKNGRPERKV